MARVVPILPRVSFDQTEKKSGGCAPSRTGNDSNGKFEIEVKISVRTLIDVT
jgi:hypothetical protein